MIDSKNSRFIHSEEPDPPHVSQTEQIDVEKFTEKKPRENFSTLRQRRENGKSLPILFDLFKGPSLGFFSPVCVSLNAKFSPAPYLSTCFSILPFSDRKNAVNVIVCHVYLVDAAVFGSSSRNQGCHN